MTVPYHVFPFLNFRDVWNKLLPELIIDGVCKYYYKDKNAVLSDCRKRELLTPRIKIIAILREYKQMPVIKIGKIVGRDHSTILHSIKQHNFLLRDEKEEREYEAVKHFLITGERKHFKEDIEITYPNKKLNKRITKLKFYERLINMKVDNWFEICEDGYWEAVNRIASALKHRKEFKDTSYKTSRIGNGKYKITRIK